MWRWPANAAPPRSWSPRWRGASSTTNQLLDTHGLYAQAVRDLAAREQVGLIDLTASSMDWLRALGDGPSKAFYMHVPEQGQADDTHFQTSGATAVACLVVAGWITLDPSMKAHVVRDTDCGARPPRWRISRRSRSPRRWCDERELAVTQPGPHGGTGETTAYPFFADAPGHAVRIPQARAASRREHRPAPARQGRDLLRPRRPRRLYAWTAGPRSARRQCHAHPLRQHPFDPPGWARKTCNC